jgi:hypothetical protein
MMSDLASGVSVEASPQLIDHPASKSWKENKRKSIKQKKKAIVLDTQLQGDLSKPSAVSPA